MNTWISRYNIALSEQREIGRVAYTGIWFEPEVCGISYASSTPHDSSMNNDYNELDSSLGNNRDERTNPPIMYEFYTMFVDLYSIDT